MPSIFFLIDHSGSMCYEYGSAQPDYPIDQWGKRFTVVYDLIDTLKMVFPSTEVGLAVFREHLYFDPSDNPRFVQCPEYDVGAYMPFFKLDSSYAPDGKMGWQILQELLEIDTVLARDDPLRPPECPDNYQYVNLKYRPSNYEHNGLSRNINAAFDAAKYAFQSSPYPKNCQFIILLSGGEATVANGPHLDPNDYVQGDSVPTTYTIFFSPTGSLPQNLIDMTTNIQNNGYSHTNMQSNIWAIDIDSLKQHMLSLLVRPVLQELVSYPEGITVNGDTGVWVPDTGGLVHYFEFKEHIPFLGVTSNFDYTVDYDVWRDSILPSGDTIYIVSDSIDSGDFEITIQDGANLPDHYPNEFFLYCWDRMLGFYYRNNLLAEINKSMDTIEVRFIEKKIDVLYRYKNVFVTIINSKGDEDFETFVLSETDSCFTRLFNIAIDSTPTPGDGILQVYERDTIIATFRNPDLPLDTMQISVPFKPSTAIHPGTVFTDGEFSYLIAKAGSKQHIIRFYNIPSNGKVQLYSINGRKIFEQSLNKGNYSFRLPVSLSQAIYFLNLEYGNSVIREKILLH